jgi:Inosine-uridine preferring nucleoside hydrolase
VRSAVVVVAVLVSSLLAGCAPPADTDGEVRAVAGGGGLGPAPARMPGDAVVPVVVDTDLGADDLLALAFLLRHPQVDVRAVTLAATGLVGCDRGVDLVAGLFAALDVPPAPVACGRSERGAGGRAFPAQWRAAAENGSGVPTVDGPAVAEPAAEVLARQARAVPGLVLVAIAPMTNVADLAIQHPDAYRGLAGIHMMAGSVSGPVVDGVAEWNAAADPLALETVLGSPVPVTVVPADAVPNGTPEVLASTPVVGRVVAGADVPAWWDLAAAAALVVGDAGAVEPGRWALDPAHPGRLVMTGNGTTSVYRSLDEPALASEYARVFAPA